MNSLYSQLNQNQSPNNITNIVNMLKKSNNPMQMLNYMANSNPQVKSVMNMVQNSNKSPKDLFYSLAQQRGIDPNQILNMLK